MSLQALIFDVDGTLAETEELHRRAFNRAFAAQGLDWHWSRADYRGLLRVTGGKERIAHFLARRGESADHAMIAALHRAKTALYAAMVEEGGLALRPGIAGLIASTSAAGLRLAVATTTSRPNVDALVRACFGTGPGAIFHAIAAGDEVGAKKPAPDVYLLALRRLRIPAHRAVALEDTGNGVRAAQAAGLRCIAARSAYAGDEVFPPPAIEIGGFDRIPSLDALRELLERRTAR